MLTNFAKIAVFTQSFDPSSIAANTVAAATALTVPGVRVGDVVLAAIKPTQTAGLGVVGARVSAENTVVVSFVNATGAPIDAGAETWTFVVATPDPGQLPSTINLG